jgi:hypothetical protein
LYSRLIEMKVYSRPMFYGEGLSDIQFRPTKLSP